MSAAHPVFASAEAEYGYRSANVVYFFLVARLAASLIRFFAIGLVISFSLLFVIFDDSEDVCFF